LTALSAGEAYDYCRAITHKHGANFSVGFRFLPSVKRRAVYAAYAYCRVADDIADEAVGSWQLAVGGSETGETDVSSSREPTTAERELALDAWQRELDACYEGRPTHPVTIALADALRHFAIPKSAFVALIDGCRQDMVKTRYETFAELLHYCELVASSISDISLAIFGYRTDRALAYGRSLATALQLTNVTRDIGDDVTRDRVYLPAEELRRFGVEEREIVEHAENDRVRQLVEFQIDRAEGYFREAEPLLRELAFDARFPTLLMGGVYATVLAKLRRQPMLAVRERIRLSSLQKMLVVGTRLLRPHFI
jgi:phytoene synthase